MADGMPRRTSTRLNLALLLAVLAVLVTASCGGEPGGGDAGSDADAYVDEPACLQRAAMCKAVQWHPDGTCDVKINVGAACYGNYGPCSGVCGADGACVYPGPEVDCGTKAKACMACDGKGGCIYKGSAASCKAATVLPCRKPTGTCWDDTSCIHQIDAGAPCKTSSPPDLDGYCSDKGECIPGVLGGPCSNQSSNNCKALTGTQTVQGDCQFEPLKKGTPCKTSPAGGCLAVCNGLGTCAFSWNGNCTVSSGSCAGKPGICSTGGACSPSPPCVEKADLLSCGDFALGQSCTKQYANTKDPTYCSAPPPYPTANSNSCGDAGDPCQPKMCSGGPGSSAICTPSQLPDGAPCPGIAANPCSAATCLSGKCQQAFKTAGTPCTPLAPKLCGPHECNAAGECASVVPAVPLAGSCTLSDGDTDCWVKSCDSAGTCTKIPRPAGQACGAVPDDACSAHRCDGKGWCVAQLTSEKVPCKHSDCLLPTATYTSPCPVGPCVYSGCAKLGLCYTYYKPAGASCEINKIVGNCDADHHCNLTGKGSQSVVGQLCIGQFHCLKEDVAYGEDGTCHGTIATGEICGTPCKPGICGADGTCQLSLAPTGTTCGNTYVCGKLECDGKGECGFPAASVGTTCGKSSWPQPAECQQYTCSVQGECSAVLAVGAACKSASPCLVGTCGASGTCEFAPISGPVCDLANPNECNSGICKVGKCEPVPKPGGPCGKETACMAYQCGTTGQCEGIPKPGASCESTGTCTKGVCDSTGQCTQVLAPGTKCMGKEQCMEGVCSQSGACMLGPKAAGSQCTAVAPGTNWDCYTGVCDGKGGCTLKVNTGAKCKEGDGACTAGVCQSDASCKAIPANLGKACTNQCATNPVCGPTGKCEGAPLSGKVCYDQCLSSATCSAQGECVGTASVGKSCGGNYVGPACQSYACSGAGKCVKTNSPPGAYCDVGAVVQSEIPSYACGSPTGSCNGSGSCVPNSPSPDGTPCGADDGCANAHVCKGGLCLPVEPKANGTPCKFGCATGLCGAGACIAFMSLDVAATGTCGDGNPCTEDYCLGSPLPGMSTYFKVSYGLDYVLAKAGTCATMANSYNCPDGKPPDTTSCKVVGCPNKNQCGAQEICLYQFDGSYYCGTPYGAGAGPACETNSPCGTSGCWSGSCTYSPVANSTPCGAFKHCYNGECKALE